MNVDDIGADSEGDEDDGEDYEHEDSGDDRDHEEDGDNPDVDDDGYDDCDGEDNKLNTVFELTHHGMATTVMRER